VLTVFDSARPLSTALTEASILCEGRQRVGGWRNHAWRL